MLHIQRDRESTLHTYLSNHLGEVMLIDDDGILDAIQGQIFEHDVGGSHHRRLVVALDSGTIGCARQGTTTEGDVPHAQFVRTLPQTPHTIYHQ